MNNRFRFRAWDLKEKTMLYRTTDCNNGYGYKYPYLCPEGKIYIEVYYHGVGGGVEEIDNNRFVLMQYTGLQDKHGKDIYEGDLIEVQRQQDKIIVECKFGTIERQMATGWLVDITGFYFEREDGTQTFPIKRNYAGKHDLEVFTVVGNIYEPKTTTE